MAEQNTFPCPACGEDVPAKAKACPHCGACDKTGWNEESAIYDGIDLPDEAFDYDKFKAEEFGHPKIWSKQEKFWWITGVVILIVFIVVTVAYYL